MNLTVLSGNLVKELEVRQTPSNKTVGRSTIAVRRNVKNKEGKYESDFVNLVFWGKQCDYITQYAKKGTKIEVKGRIETGSYQDKDGKTVYTTEVVVEEANILTYPQNVDNSVDNSANATGNSDFEQVTDEDLPF